MSTFSPFFRRFRWMKFTVFSPFQWRDLRRIYYENNRFSTVYRWVRLHRIFPVFSSVSRLLFVSRFQPFFSRFSAVFSSVIRLLSGFAFDVFSTFSRLFLVCYWASLFVVYLSFFDCFSTVMAFRHSSFFRLLFACYSPVTRLFSMGE